VEIYLAPIRLSMFKTANSSTLIIPKLSRNIIDFFIDLV
jgi:hypothetical protein